ncbi:MAG TPA: universal stress protein [Ktedonobacteraceae bacterium]|nr:universal stress protein [Ktedonobacteraceae bacterium]
MFQRQKDTKILIPLDGSLRAEQAIPVAARIARASGGSVMLLRVVSIPVEYTPHMYGSYSTAVVHNLRDAKLEEAKHYLAATAQSEPLVGIRTETEAFSGAAAPTILDVARKQHIDLIVMCSHGYTGFKRWMLGSVAQQVARHSSAPVLVLRDGGSLPTSSFPDPARPLRALMGLVALDGSELAESALVPAAHLVAALAAPARGILQLTYVVPFPASEHEESNRSRTDSYAKEQAIYEAESYLSAVADRLRSLHLGVVCSVTAGEDVADALIRIAEQGEAVESTGLMGSCDLLVMATHGRSGWQRWTMGSVTERVLGATRLPLLIVRTCPPDKIPL